MLSIVKALTDTANYCKTLKEFFSLCNKTLWSGTFNTGSITVPDTDKYHFCKNRNSFNSRRLYRNNTKCGRNCDISNCNILQKIFERTYGNNWYVRSTTSHYLPNYRNTENSKQFCSNYIRHKYNRKRNTLDCYRQVLNTLLGKRWCYA